MKMILLASSLIRDVIFVVWAGRFELSRLNLSLCLSKFGWLHVYCFCWFEPMAFWFLFGIRFVNESGKTEISNFLFFKVENGIELLFKSVNLMLFVALMNILWSWPRKYLCWKAKTNPKKIAWTWATSVASTAHCYHSNNIDQ